VSVSLVVTNNIETITSGMSVWPSPKVSDVTVQGLILSKAASLNAFETQLQAQGHANPAFILGRLQSLTGLNAVQAATLLTDATMYKAHAISGAQVSAALSPNYSAIPSVAWPQMYSNLSILCEGAEGFTCEDEPGGAV
jgi:hypothetical protein